MRNELPADLVYDPCYEQAEKRAMKNCALVYITLLGEPVMLAECKQRFLTTTNFTDRMGALAGLMSFDCPQR